MERTWRRWRVERRSEESERCEERVMETGFWRDITSSGEGVSEGVTKRQQEMRSAGRVDGWRISEVKHWYECQRAGIGGAMCGGRMQLNFN